jgi:acetyl esterase/lipase
VEHYQALKRAGVSAELHVYAKTPHAFGFRENKTSRPVDAWPQRFAEFLAAQGMTKKE